MKTKGLNEDGDSGQRKAQILKTFREESQQDLTILKRWWLGYGPPGLGSGMRVACDHKVSLLKAFCFPAKSFSASVCCQR